MKQAYKAARPLSDDPWDDAMGTPKVLIRIEGMREVVGEPGLFEIAGVRPRPIDWPAVAKGLGNLDGTVPEALAEQINAVVFKHDLIEFLAHNATPA